MLLAVDAWKGSETFRKYMVKSREIMDEINRKLAVHLATSILDRQDIPDRESTGAIRGKDKP